MRFGIMTMQRGELIPSGLSPAGMLDHLARFDHAELARRLFQHGFDPIELGGDMPLFLPTTLDGGTIERFALLRQDRGVCYTVHLRLWSVEPSTPLDPVRVGSVRALIDTVQATLPLEPEVFVLHATGALAAEFYRMELPDLARSFILRQFQACAQQSVHILLSETGLTSRRLAVETVEFPFDLTMEMSERMDLSLCLDTGHVLAGFAGAIELMEPTERCLPRLAEIHLHDAPRQGPEHVIGYGKDHQPLGTGDLDLAAFLDRLSAAKFAGPLIFELTIPESLASMEPVGRLRPDLLPQVAQ